MSKNPVMSEAELLRMPEQDYMNARQKEFFRLQLQALRAETQETIEAIKCGIAANEREADELDRAAAEEENRQRMRIAERQFLLLRKIDKALNHLEDGSYGYCEVTGVPIGLRRLLLRPTAGLCIEEKTRQERLERNYIKQRG